MKSARGLSRMGGVFFGKVSVHGESILTPFCYEYVREVEEA